MNRNITPKEIASWLILVTAAVLFTVTVSVAQSQSTSIDRNDDKVTIRISKEKDGKTIEVDTTFTSTDEADVTRAMEKISKDYGLNLRTGVSKHGRSNAYVFSADDESLEKIMEEVNEAMAEAGKGLEEARKELKELHIEITGKEGKEDFNFNFSMPEMPEIPEIDFNFPHSYKYRFHHDENIPDSLRGRDHFIIRGEEGEKTPELKEVIKGKDGSQYFVYKRSIPEKPKAEEVVGIRGLKYFPNPSAGKITVSFRSPSESDITVQLTDMNGREIYNEKLKKFSGQYEKQIDITKEGKGSYLLKIMQDDTTITKKIVVQ